MTKNQIDYWKYVEERRHNMEMERQGQSSISETKRSHLADEGIRRSTNVINQMHYERQDAINAASQIENARHNSVNEAIDWATLAESNRHNKVTEAFTERDLARKDLELAEDIRSHKANESINWANVSINKQNADTNLMNARTNLLDYQSKDRERQSNIEYNDAQISLANKKATTEVLSWDKLKAEVDKIQSEQLRAEAEAKLKEAQTKNMDLENATYMIRNIISYGSTALNAVTNYKHNASQDFNNSLNTAFGIAGTIFKFAN